MSEEQDKAVIRREPFARLDSKEIFALAERKMEDGRRFLDPYLTMEVLAAEMNVHRNALSGAVNQYAGVSFPDWLSGYRVAEVERLAGLAENSGASWKQLARTAGFSNRTSFYRAFRKLRGGAPGEALRKHRNQNETK